MVIKDQTTPANAFSGDPNSKLTYTSPSTWWKRTRGGIWAANSTITTEYDETETVLGFGVWEGRTWLALNNRDGAQATWTKTNGTAARTATGPDGVSSSCTTFTATSANATILQSITSASNARVTSALVRRRTGSGTIEMTQDGGATWTNITSGVSAAGYVRKGVTVQTLTNPQVGFRLATSGDEIDFDLFGHEVGSFWTPPVTVGGSTVNRAADNISLAASLFPSSTVGLLAVKFRMASVAAGQAYAAQLYETTGGNQMALGRNTAGGGVGEYDFYVQKTGADQAWLRSATAAANVSVRLAAAYGVNDFAFTPNGGTVQTDSLGNPPNPVSLYIGRGNFGTNQINGHIASLIHLPRVRASGAELQGLLA